MCVCVCVCIGEENYPSTWISTHVCEPPNMTSITISTCKSARDKQVYISIPIIQQELLQGYNIRSNEAMALTRVLARNGKTIATISLQSLKEETL